MKHLLYIAIRAEIRKLGNTEMARMRIPFLRTIWKIDIKKVAEYFEQNYEEMIKFDHILESYNEMYRNKSNENFRNHPGDRIWIK